MSDAHRFGAWVKDRRKALDLTQQDLAERTECALVTISKIERGLLRPSKQVAALLAAALRVPPDERAAFLQLARGGAPGAAGDAPAPAAPAGPPHNLPAQLTTLIGREAVVEAIADVIGPPEERAPGGPTGALSAGPRRARLFTLTGPPGIGKTRLALEVARRVLPAFADGVFFVNLAPVDEPGLWLAALLQTLGLRAAGSAAPLAQLTAHLRARRALLVLDNFEQVLAAAPLLAELLTVCPHLWALVTSRERLRVRGERHLLVPALAVPEAGPGGVGRPAPTGDVAALLAYSAVALFAERAAEARPGFTLTPANAAAVVSICRHLDGLPLAIELVAARLNLFTPEALADRLGGGAPDRPRALSLLVEGARDLPARQRTLRDAIGWSYHLLSDGEQRLLRRLAVFAGEVTLAAVEAVCNPVGDLGLDVLAGISSLLLKNLLRRAPEAGGDDAPRIGMLETVREYALEQLEQDAEDEGRVRRWHAEYYLSLIEVWRPYRLSDSARLWYDSLTRERGNIRAALEWALRTGALEIAAHLMLELVDLWITGGFAEGRRALARMLELSPALPAPTRARVLFQGARLYIVFGEPARAETLLSEGLPLLDELADEQQRAQFLLALGGVALGNRAWAAARAYFEQVRALCAAADADGAASEPAIRALNGLGEVARAEQDSAAARAFYAEALARQRPLGERYATAVLTCNLAKAEIKLGRYTDARAHLRAAIALYQRLGTTAAIAACLNGLAEAAVWQGAAAPGPPTAARLAGLEQAALLFAAAQAEHDRTAYVPASPDLEEREEAHAAGRLALGDTRWRSAWQRGGALSLAEAVALDARTADPRD